MKKFDINGTVLNNEEAPAKRVPYINACGNINAEGKIAGVPTDFDGSAHLAPKKDEFANPADFYEFKAVQAEAKAAELSATAAKHREEAENIRKFGDPTKRAMAKRAAKLRDQLAALEQQLQAEGIEV